jgi:hypothetical protein
MERKNVMSIHKYRRLTGLLFGTGLGLMYGLTSQLINRILLPGVPLYQPPLGPFGNILASVLVGALLGAICAWPESSINGTFIASAVAAAVILIGNAVLAEPGRSALGTRLLTSIVLILPFWALLAILIAALRWAVNKLVDAHADHLPLRARVAVPAVLLLIVGLVGALPTYRGEARMLLARTHALLREGQAAADAEALPGPLRVPAAGPFLEAGRVPYALSWQRQGIEKYRIARPIENFDNHSAVVARFENNWNLVCVYITPERPPLCQAFEELPR